MSGEPTLPEAELKTQAWYFIFQVIQVFLVTTFSSGAAAVATSIARDPSQVPHLLAENLPKASNFYLSYFILQGIAGAPDKLLNYSDLFEYLFYSKYIDNTPRDKYKRFTNMKGIPWATQYPKFVNFLVIAVAYSCIAPLVLGFATVGLYLFYLAFSYNMLYVYQVKVDSKGDCYARSLEHIMTGVYMSELCLIGLFGARKAAGPSILLVILLVITIIYHTIVDRLLSPLELYLPTNDDKNAEEEPLMAAEEAREDDSTPYRAQGHHIHAISLPTFIIKPSMKYMQPFIDRFRAQITSILHHPTAREDDTPEYTEDQLRDAYLNPALTSKTPKLWLARDEIEVSKKELEANKEVGIEGTDDGAWFDEHGNVQFEREDFEKVPIFKRPVNY